MTAALYIHIPFCEKRCTYCDFYTVAWRNPPLAEYVDLLQREMALWRQRSGFAELRFETVFFGGGTPSLLAPKLIGRLLEAAFRFFRFTDEPEITLEANPGSVDLDTLRGYRAVGVNRISFGAQSFLPQELALIERIHSPEDVCDCVRWARQAGFGNLSLDLIFALPGQRLEQWAYNLSQAVALEPDHLSTYNLTIEEGTPLAHRIRRGELRPCSEAEERRMYMHTLDFLEAHGYPQYEVSNFARAGFACRHNLKYWDGSPYLGVGASAHSFLDDRRFWNVANLGRYREAIERGEFATEAEERLTRSQAMFETIFLNLRQSAGLQLADFERRFGVPLSQVYGEVLRRLFPEGFNGSLKADARGKWFEIKDGYLRLTREGLLLADALCAEFEPRPPMHANKRP
jgi:oxygen-independent coproporphyrinogen-3 oxidase